MALKTRLVGALGAAALLAVPALAQAAETHSGQLSENASDSTPSLVVTTAVPRPRVDAITADSTTTYAGGNFDRVTSAGTTYSRSNLVAFDASSGAVDEDFAPTFDNGIRAVENAPSGGVYAGGDFTTVNGAPRPSLVKLTSAGVVDAGFKPPFGAGIVYDAEMVDGHLVVAGSFPQKLMSLDPDTGVADGYIKPTIGGQVCLSSGVCSWGTTSVYDFSVAGNRLAAVGNFTQVNGQPRSKFFMLDLSSGAAELDPWYYDSFAKPCATDHPRRIANLQGVDWNPAGTAFNIAATGQIPEESSEVWHQGDGPQTAATVCDALGRFQYSNDDKAEWINYTGGDSMWTVQDTGNAVYVQGHFKYVDNPDGYASLGIGDRSTGTPASRRSGIAAIDPASGLALPWNPAVPTKTGGKALEATERGLWVGSDSAKFGAEAHYGIAYAPLR